MHSEMIELARIFRELGAKDPEGWASSQIREGIPQLHRYLFLRKAWQLVVHEENDDWIDACAERYRLRPDEPFAARGRAIDRMLQLGVDRADIVDLVRAMQAELLFNLCYLLEDPDLDEKEEDVAGPIGWALVATDGDDEPTSTTIGGLHESVLETDPTGREMRPR